MTSSLHACLVLVSVLLATVISTMLVNSVQGSFPRGLRRHQPLHNELSNDYQDPVARLMLQYASVAYCSHMSILYWNLNSNCSAIQNDFVPVSVVYAEPTDALGYVGKSDSQQIIVVAFKGTNPAHLRDWIDDLLGSLNYNFTCNLSGGASYQGEEGFYLYYMSLKNLGFLNDVVGLIQQYPNYQVFVVGHSLGGAAAAIQAADLIHSVGASTLNNLQLYTFGEPRVGDITFSYLMETGYTISSQLNRVIHASDIVPHLPPCCPGAYIGNCSASPECPYHAPREYWYNNNMAPGATYFQCSGVYGEDPSCSDSQVDVSISDHLVYFGFDVSQACC